jgi:hypothetical protein
VTHRCRQDEHAAGPDRMGRPVFEIEFAGAGEMYCVSSVASVCQPSRLPGSIS